MANKKRLQVWLPLLLSLCVIAGMFVGYRIRGNMPNKGIFFVEKPKPVQEVLDLIQRKYVDDINVDSLGNIALQTILDGLDPHSVYIPTKQLQQVNEDLEGVFYGIGVEFTIINDTTNVIRVIEGGPSEKAGLKTGDKFIRVNDSLIAGNHTSEESLKNLMRGKGGTKVKATLLRNGNIIQKEITRGPIRLYSIDASYMLNDTTGFIRISRFSETTYKEFMAAMDKLHGKGMKALILDLRDNGGGILTEAVHIADEFLSQDKLITYTEGAHVPKKEYKCDKEGVFEKGTLIVLINEGTASASEILAGALQDWGRATIVGRRSFGKGLVQEQYELSDGSGLRLTVARYYTPLGRSIQKSYADGNEEYYHDILNRYKHGEMEYADSIKHNNQKKYISKTGKVLYGGGGISPDIFVPVDTLAFEKPVMKALLKGTLNDFVFKNYVSHQKEFAKYKTPDQLEKNYKVDDSTFKRLQQYAKQDSIQFNFSNANEKKQLAIQIKTLTARLIWGDEGFFEIKNFMDPMIDSSKKVLGIEPERTDSLQKHK